MLTLAIDQSSRRGSAAILDGDRTLLSQDWANEMSSRQNLFSVVSALCREAGVEPRSCDLLAIGLGPGIFSGLRMSLAAVQAIALPHGVGVYGVSSAEVIAWAFLQQGDAECVTVLGDARRDRLWFSAWVRAPENLARCLSGPELIACAELPARLPGNCLVAGPDWERLKDTLPSLVGARAQLYEEAAFPAADALGRLACRRKHLGRESEPLNPLYMHPPVFVEPRFPGR